MGGGSGGRRRANVQGGKCPGGLFGHLTPLLIEPVSLVSQGRFEEPVHP